MTMTFLRRFYDFYQKMQKKKTVKFAKRWLSKKIKFSAFVKFKQCGFFSRAEKLTVITFYGGFSYKKAKVAFSWDLE